MTNKKIEGETPAGWALAWAEPFTMLGFQAPLVMRLLLPAPPYVIVPPPYKT